MDFRERMGHAPDEELVMITSSDSFVPAARDAAKAELERRNLRPDEFARMRAYVEELRQADENKASVPLGTVGKIAFLIFGPVLFWSVAAAIVLAYRGYRRKRNQAFMWIVIGNVFWLCVTLSILEFT